jgi:proteic killer suppression protein
VIRGYADRETERLFLRERVKRLPADIHRVALRKLRMMHRATDLRDLRVPPANRLEALKGDRVGQYSIRVNAQFRICFRWESGACFDVELVDYH